MPWPRNSSHRAHRRLGLGPLGHSPAAGRRPGGRSPRSLHALELPAGRARGCPEPSRLPPPRRPHRPGPRRAQGPQPRNWRRGRERLRRGARGGQDAAHGSRLHPGPSVRQVPGPGPRVPGLARPPAHLLSPGALALFTRVARRPAGPALAQAPPRPRPWRRPRPVGDTTCPRPSGSAAGALARRRG